MKNQKEPAAPADGATKSKRNKSFTTVGVYKETAELLHEICELAETTPAQFLKSLIDAASAKLRPKLDQHRQQTALLKSEVIDELAKITEVL